MFFKNMYSDPGRRNKLTSGMVFFIIILLILQGSTLVCALNLAVKTRVRVIWLDPFLQISIQGADGYAVAEPVFDRDAFRSSFENMLQKADPTLQQEEVSELSEITADSMVYEFHIEEGDGETNVSIVDAEEAAVNEQEGFELPVPGISNGDTVTVFADISDETWSLLRDRGFFLAFECDPVEVTAEGLTEAAPYDPFEELSVSFTGLDSVGTAEIYYNGSYPFSFSAEPSEGLSNGDTIEISLSLNEGYDLTRIVEEYHIMPVSLSRQFTVSGLYVNPTEIGSFTAENRDLLMQQGRLAASALLEDEYEEGETFVLADAGMFFAAGEQDSAAQNYLFCVFTVNYTNSSGEDLQYYYFIRFENLMLDDAGEVAADFTQYAYPQKPSIPFIGETLGDGAEVSVPGILSFRTLAGYETPEQLISRVITPLEPAYTVTSIEQNQ